MTPSQVARVLTDLANGTNPLTGEALPRESPYCDPQIIRALFTAVQRIEQPATGADSQRSPAANAGRPWSREEDEQLVHEFDARTRNC
jgi:hypothetical protein